MLPAAQFGGGLTALELETPEVGGPAAGQTAHVSRILAQGGRRGLERSIRSWEKTLAEHYAKLQQYQSAGTPTSDIVRTIRNLQGLIQAARSLLGE